MVKIQGKNKKEKSVTLADIACLIADSHDSLARTVAKGFESVDKRFEDVNRRFEGVDKRFESIDKKIENMEDKMNQQFHGLGNRIDDLALNRATRDEFYILSQRVERVERQVGIKK